MANYEDQNSSEYKDMNQETPAADQNPHSAGNVPQNPNPAQPDQQNPPQNDGQIPPQNSGQNPYWQNQQNGGQIPPQNPGQDPYWQNPQNGRQIPPQHPGQNPYWQNQQNSGQFPPQNGQPPYWQNQYNNGQPPYWQNQPQRPRREKNSFATISLISGIFALLTLCCFAFPVAIICGVGAVCFAIISKKGQPFRGTAAAGIILGVIAVLLGIGEFFYVLTITNLMKDPANAAAFNEFFEQFQRQLGIN
ncbi:hypothetical protein DXB03_07670 [Lachnospiraceae bacterium OF11-28]|jgi:hypothetical protein|nr:hypothetical protein DXB03_07670 [Lachnospiraceae bacterium OF11-28]UYJ12901.1 MAG: hypothetical protein OGM13_10675 [Lachnospiraceae bacterium]